MKYSILVASIIIALVVKYIISPDQSTPCADYQLLGRTYEKCLTDKRLNE